MSQNDVTQIFLSQFVAADLGCGLGQHTGALTSPLWLHLSHWAFSDIETSPFDFLHLTNAWITAVHCALAYLLGGAQAVFDLQGVPGAFGVLCNGKLYTLHRNLPYRNEADTELVIPQHRIQTVD